jgi:hypothetical protein
MVMQMTPQGWCTDPYGLHEARWMSAGQPTKLVLDQGKESYDKVPEGEPVFDARPYDGPFGPRETWALRGTSLTAVSAESALKRLAARVLHPIHD